MAAPRKTTPVTDKKVAAEYAEGATVSSIVEKFGISAGTVRSIVVREGGTLRPVGRPKNPTA